MAWKTVLEVLAILRRLPASMGPRFNGVEDAGYASPVTIRYTGFNGATL